MNVSKSSQLELALLLRTLKVLRSCPGLSMASFFEQMMPVLKGASDRSYSAYWVEKYRETEKDLKSLVCIRSAGDAAAAGDPADQKDTEIVNIKELEYLKHAFHADSKHDPLLVVRTIYNTALGSLLASSPEQQAVLLLACIVLAAKSGRASLLLNATVLCYLLKDEALSMDGQLLASIHANCLAASRRDPAKGIVEDLLRAHHEACNDDDGSASTFVLSFGKADHGTPSLSSCLCLLLCSC